MKLKDMIIESATRTPNQEEQYSRALSKIRQRQAEQLSEIPAMQGITRATRKTIETAISLLPEEKKHNRYEITQKVSEILINRLGDQEDNKDRDNKLNRSKVPTSGAILKAVDYYILTH